MVCSCFTLPTILHCTTHSKGSLSMLAPYGLATLYPLCSLPLFGKGHTLVLAPFRVRGAGLAPFGVRRAWLAPFGVRRAGLAPFGVRRAGLAPFGVRRAGLAPFWVRRAGLAPFGVRRAGLAPFRVRRAGLTPSVGGVAVLLGWPPPPLSWLLTVA